MNFFENIKIAINSIRSNLLRSILTLLIISVGIACLVGILTAIDTVLNSLSSNFNRIGANSFTVYPDYNSVQGNQNGRRRKRSEEISFKQAMAFKDKYDYPGSEVSINFFCSSRATVKYGDEKTNPTTAVVGIDDTYLDVSAYELSAGRNFTKTEVNSGNRKCILAAGMVKKFFDDDPEKAIGKVIIVGSDRFKIIGTCKSKGSSMNQSGENRVFMPLLCAKILYGHDDSNYNIVGAVKQATQIDEAVSTAIGIFRIIRKLKFSEENDFIVRKSDGILQILKDMTTELRMITIVIAFLTLLGASIGLMNIMLVSVTERTKEIGIRKALGATSSNILFQFLTEAVVLTLLGGLVGIILGVLLGLGVSALVGGGFVFPVAWVSLGILVCVVVGVLSGLYPSTKASKMDPIESLRYE